jgi:hypothetical protein
MMTFLAGGALVPATTDDELPADCVACVNCTAFAWAGRDTPLPAQVQTAPLPAKERAARGMDAEFVNLSPALSARLEAIRMALKNQGIALPNIETEPQARLRFLAGFGLCLASPPGKADLRASHPLTYRSWRCNAFVKLGSMVVAESRARRQG